jgi:ubiquitin C-terminal hydrolase
MTERNIMIRQKLYENIKERYDKKFSHLTHNTTLYNLKRVECRNQECNHNTYSLSHDNTLIIPIHERQPTSLYNCIDKLYEDEVI